MDMTKVMPSASPEAINLLHMMLKWDP